jgi:hypothetical protein
MESSLHRELKSRYAAPGGGTVEFRQGAFVADAIGPDGEWVEIQCSPLGSLGSKLGPLLSGDREIKVVKPIVLTRRIVQAGGSVRGRLSPHRGVLLDVFDELVHVMRHFPHERLTIEAVGVHIEEVRVSHRRRRGFEVADRRLCEVGAAVSLRTGDDLWSLLPATGSGLPEPFCTLDLDRFLGRGQPFAQRVAYCLRLAGAVRTEGFRARRRLYGRVESSRANDSTPPLLAACGDPTIAETTASLRSTGRLLPRLVGRLRG